MLEPQLLPGARRRLARRLDEHATEPSRVSSAMWPSPPKRWRCSCATSSPSCHRCRKRTGSRRLLGRERFEVFVAQVGRRMPSDRRLVSEVLEPIAEHDPDLFGTRFFGRRSCADESQAPQPNPQARRGQWC